MYRSPTQAELILLRSMKEVNVQKQLCKLFSYLIKSKDLKLINILYSCYFLYQRLSIRLYGEKLGAMLHVRDRTPRSPTMRAPPPTRQLGSCATAPRVPRGDRLASS
jgi:hypothetical protein